MAKVTLSNITSGYSSVASLNATFNIIEDTFNNKVLYRDNPDGEPNQMENDLDLNGNDLLNVGSFQATELTVNGIDYLAQMNEVYNNYSSITQRVTVSTAAPSDGSDGDIWFKIT